jgi:hypothetical protein
MAFRGARDGRFLQSVDRRDVLVIERSEDARLPFEARQMLGIAGQRRREDLDRDVAPEPRVAGAIDLPIAPAPRSDPIS